MKILMIDDIPDSKQINHTPTRVAVTFKQALVAIQEGPWDIVYLDHDLGDMDEKKTGYAILSFIERHPEFLPKQIVLTTRNPVGRKNMQMVLNKLY